MQWRSSHHQTSSSPTKKIVIILFCFQMLFMLNIIRLLYRCCNRITQVDDVVHLFGISSHTRWFTLVDNDLVHCFELQFLHRHETPSCFHAFRSSDVFPAHERNKNQSCFWIKLEWAFHKIQREPFQMFTSPSLSSWIYSGT
jgi:hypothetical protein